MGWFATLFGGRPAAPAPHAKSPVDLREGLEAVRREVSEADAKALWNRVSDGVRDELFVLCRAHHDHDEGEMPIAGADEVWGTLVDPSVEVTAGDALTLTTATTWGGDDHWITVYVEEGEVRGHSIDG